MTALLPRVATRRAVASDDRLLREAFASTRPAIFLLDPDVRDMLLDMQYHDQKRRRLAEHPHAERLVLTIGDEDAGVLEMERTANGVHVIDLMVRHRFRRRGIAASALMMLSAEDHVTIEISARNQPGRELCERVGFHVVTHSHDRLTLAS